MCGHVAVLELSAPTELLHQNCLGFDRLAPRKMSAVCLQPHALHLAVLAGIGVSC